jgi:hypothetical protein
VLPLHALLFFLFWIEVMDPCFILSYVPVDKIRLFLVAGQEISWNIKPGSFLVVSRLSGDPSSGNLWHAIDISQNFLNWTKAYNHFPSILRRSRLLLHMTMCAQLRQFHRWLSLLAAQAAHHVQCSPLSLLNSAAYFFTVL